MPTKPNDKRKNRDKPKRKTREIRNPKTGELEGSQSLDGASTTDIPTALRTSQKNKSVKTKTSKAPDASRIRKNALKLIKKDTFPATLKSGFPKGINREEMFKVYLKLAKEMGYPHQEEVYDPETIDRIITELIPQVYGSEEVKVSYYGLELQNAPAIEAIENEKAGNGEELNYIDEHRHAAIYLAYEWAYNEILSYLGYTWGHDQDLPRVGRWYSNVSEARAAHAVAVPTFRVWRKNVFFEGFNL